MQSFKKQFEEFFEKIKKYFVGSDKAEGKKKITRKKWLNLILVLLLGFIVFVVMLLFISNNEASKVSNDTDFVSQHNNIELATDVTGSDVKWQNFLEESIETEGKTREEQIALLKQTLIKSQESSKEEVNNEFTEFKARLSYSLREIDRLKANHQNIQTEIASLSREDNEIALPAELGITAITKSEVTKPPVSSFNHILATSYVSGHLLGGIAVSTSVNSASEPIPVIIKLTNRGNLPADFAVDIKECRLLASCYGDISSERVIIRAEELVCENKGAGLITTTKVSGVIYGDDGANGIRGTVVSMSEKHLKNAFIGGLLSGFANTANGQNSLDITAIGASTKKRGMKDMAQDGLLGGASSASEKLADYHIKLAENISPVILVPGGTKVDVMFTKSVEIGSVDIHEVINAERVGK
ncbi:MAG: hypothetical protein COB76_02165 [Alphaproteobacteria bacterium]|nr:MAG: hypothetical protein COB76_02165 [Alphaproteobacteria bacterium]